MPAQECLGLDVDQSSLPSKEMREQDHGQANRIGGPPGFDLTFQVESQLLPKENVLRLEGRARTGSQQQEPQSVVGQSEEDEDQTKQGLSGSHGIGACHGGPGRSNLASQ
jgi:hypothetical protein